MNLGTLTVTLGVISTDLDKVVPKINTVAQRFRTFGYLASATLTLPIVAAGKAALNTAKEFEYSMQKMVGLAGVSQRSINDWSDAVLAMAPKVAKGPKELADALYFIASSGIKGSEALNVLEISAKAATAGLGETKDVADFLTSALNAYKGSNLTAARAADILVAAVREGKGEASAFATAMGGIIPIASQLGVSLDQVAGGMAAITLTGSSVASAAVYLKGLFNVLLKAPSSGEKDLAALGTMKTSYQELRKILASGPSGLINLMQKLRDLQMQYGDELMSDVLPNIRALTGYLSIAGKNFEYNTSIMKKISNASGSLATAFAGVSNTIKVQLDQALAKAQVSLIKLGQAIAPTIIDILNKLVAKLGQLINWWNSLSKAEQDHKLRIVALMAIIGPLSLILSTLIYTVSGLASAFSTLASVYSVLTKQIVVTEIWTKLGVAIKGALLGSGFVAEEMAAKTGAAVAKAAAATKEAAMAGNAVKMAASSNIAAATAEVVAAERAAKATRELTAAKKAGVNVVNFLSVSTKEVAAVEAAAAAKAASAVKIAAAAELSAATAQSATLAKLAANAKLAAEGEMAVAGGMNAIAVSAEATMTAVSAVVIGIVGLAVALVPILLLWNKIKDLKKQIAEGKEVQSMTVPKEEISELIDKLLHRNAGTADKPKWVSRLRDLSEEQLKEAQNLLNQRIALEQEGLDKLRGISEEDLNNQEFVYSRRKKIETALNMLDEKKKSGKYSTTEIKAWSDQTKVYIQSVQDAIEDYKNTITKQEQLKGIMKDPEIEKAQKEIARLNAQLEGIKRNQGAGGYSASVVKDYTEQTNMAIKEQEDIIHRVTAAKREQIGIDMAYAQSNIDSFTKQRDEVQHTLDVIEKYHEAIAAQVAEQDAFDKAWTSMLTKIKVAKEMAEVNKTLGKSYDLAATEADIYLSTLEDLMTQFNVDSNSPAYKKIMQWLKELGIDFSETGQHAKKFAEELAAIDLKNALLGTNFNAGAAKLEIYKNQFDDLIKDISKKNAIEISPIDFKNIDEALKRINEAQESSERFTDMQQVNMLQAEANAFGTLGAKIEVYNMEIQAAERHLRSMLQARLTGGAAGASITDSAIKREVENIQNLKSGYVDLQNSAALKYLQDMDKAVGNLDTTSALFNGQLSAMQEEFKFMSENGLQTTERFKELSKQLDEFAKAQKTTEYLTEAFDSLFDAIMNGGKNMGEVLKNVMKSILADIIKTYVHMMILKTAMTAFKVASMVVNPFNIIPAILGLGGSATAATGGIVPPGYPNDTYPARLTSGETIIPLSKLDNVLKKSSGFEGEVRFEIEGDKLVGILKKKAKQNSLY